MHNYNSQDTTELAKALINVQRQLQPATKDADNPFTKSKYATLNSVMDSCRDALYSRMVSGSASILFLPNRDISGWSRNLPMRNRDNGSRALR